MSILAQNCHIGLKFRRACEMCSSDLMKCQRLSSPEGGSRCQRCFTNDLPCSFTRDHEKARANEESERMRKLEELVAGSQAQLTNLTASLGVEYQKMTTRFQTEHAAFIAHLEAKALKLEKVVEEINLSIDQLRRSISATTRRSKEAHSYAQQFSLRQ